MQREILNLKALLRESRILVDRKTIKVGIETDEQMWQWKDLLKRIDAALEKEIP